MSTTNQGTTKIGLIAAFLCTVITVALISAAFWQFSVADSKTSDAEKHESAAALFKQAEAEGTQAGTLLQEYVATGDATLIQQINEHTSTGVTLLTTAVQESGIDGQPLVDGGSALVQAEGQIIALRQAGDVQGAITAMTQLAEQFQAFLETQQGIISAQEAAAATARSDSDSAESLTSILAIAAAIGAIAAVASGIVHVRLNAARRRSLDAIPSA